MPITRHKLSAPLRLSVVMCWLGVAFLGVFAISLLVVGLDLRHHAVRTTATVTAFYRTGHGGYHTTLTFTGPGGGRVTESTNDLASAPARGARVPIYYVPGDPGEFQDARLGPPGLIELVIAAVVGAIALVLTAGVIVLPRHLVRMGAGRIR
jgi:Protein of unknown function (DUF3592)